MARKLCKYFIRMGCIASLSLALAACGFYERPQRPAWRDTAERACLASKVVKTSRYVTPRPAIDGPGICGLNNPFHVTALANGAVTIKSRATLGCPMIATLDRWLADVVQPAAMARFGQPVREISTMGSYGCRTRNHRPGAKLSEHGFGNALDIGAFTLANGATLKVVKHWRRGDQQEQAFLRETHAGACRYFRTVLGPGSDRLHENHLHLDLAMHGKTSRGLRHYCRPVIKDIAPPPRRDNLPDPPYLEPDQEIARRANRNRTFALGNLPRGRLRPIPGYSTAPTAMNRNTASSFENRTYGRLRQLDAGAPAQINPMQHALPNTRGRYRADGVYVPPGM